MVGASQVLFKCQFSRPIVPAADQLTVSIIKLIRRSKVVVIATETHTHPALPQGSVIQPQQMSGTTKFPTDTG